MKPAAFDDVAPKSLEAAVAALAAANGDGKVLAGGQSLMPLLSSRMARPAVVVDLMHIPGLSFIELRDDKVAIGAMTRHADLEFSELVAAKLPVMAAAMRHVAHLAIRNKGTIGGSLSHADPAAELPLLALLLDAGIRTRAAAGPRTHAARDFFVGPLTTSLAADELVTEIALPALPPGTGWGFEEFSLRAGDFAFAAVGATVTLADGAIVEARLAVMGVGETPLRLRELEAGLRGTRLS